MHMKMSQEPSTYTLPVSGSPTGLLHPTRSAGYIGKPNVVTMLPKRLRPSWHPGTSNAHLHATYLARHAGWCTAGHSWRSGVQGPPMSSRFQIRLLSSPPSGSQDSGNPDSLRPYHRRRGPASRASLPPSPSESGAGQAEPIRANDADKARVSGSKSVASVKSRQMEWSLMMYKRGHRDKLFRRIGAHATYCQSKCSSVGSKFGAANDQNPHLAYRSMSDTPGGISTDIWGRMGCRRPSNSIAASSSHSRIT